MGSDTKTNRKGYISEQCRPKNQKVEILAAKYRLIKKHRERQITSSK